jgi:predicted ArsR family transcriptional regulator
VPEQETTWTFLTNHTLVLMTISRDPDQRIRDIAATVGITERAAQQIVRDLEQGGYLSVTKTGRRNSYRVHANRPLRHPLQRGYRVGDLLSAFPVRQGGGRRGRRGSGA